MLALIGISVFAPADTESVAAASTTVPINMIYYGWHDSTVDNSIISAKPEFLVDNSPAGPWKGNASISKFTSAGIKYFEYIDGGYEGTAKQAIPNDLQSNLNYISAAAAAGAYGVFLDEVSSSPSSASLNYLKQIADKAHSLGLKVVFNVGVDSWSDSLMAYCDFINSSEIWNNAPLTASQSKWASRTWLLTQDLTDATTAAYLTNSAISEGINAHYGTTSYGALPTWLGSYVSLISTSTSTPTPTPAPATGQTSVTFNSNPGGAEIWLDYSYKGPTPLTLSVPTGNHHIGFFLYGYHSNTALEGDFLLGDVARIINGDLLSGQITYSDAVSPTPTPVLVDPAVETGTASSISTTSAVLNGNLTGLGSASTVSVSFEWGATTAYGNMTTANAMTATGAFNTVITSLAPNTTYHFRTKAVGSLTVYGSDVTFNTLTPVVAPTVTTGTASSISTTSATLNGNLTGLGSASTVSVSFEWGTTTAYGKTTAAKTVTATGAFNTAIFGLTPNTTYHFRSKAVGSSTVYGSDVTFKTARRGTR
jgi:hypothetical protein